MNHYHKIIASLFIFNTFVMSNAHAIVVDFDTGALNIEDTFFEVNLGSPVQTLSGVTFGANNGITFSGGVLLADPTNGNAGQVSNDGSFYYGTAFSPSTNAQTSPAGWPAELPDTITIEISPDENITSVSGIFINGLNGNIIGENADYEVKFYTGNDDAFVELEQQNFMDTVFNNGMTTEMFGLDTSTLMGSALNALITKVEITALGVDFGRECTPDEIENNCSGPILEWDFLLDSVSFNEGISPVPVPAALPLFMSALLGGLAFARPRKSSEAA